LSPKRKGRVPFVSSLRFGRSEDNYRTPEVAPMSQPGDPGAGIHAMPGPSLTNHRLVFKSTLRKIMSYRSRNAEVWPLFEVGSIFKQKMMMSL
jgi:hypothetical protein